VRPLRLEVEKFLGLESLNLDFESSLFVLIGPNGAGKSSILEAIFFALFGRGIRLERGKRELINRGYPEGPLRVSLEFLLGGSEFRVVREYSPRGGVAVLEKKENGVWNSLTSGEQSVNQKIEEILGFDYLTFKSSVFLPQGETLSFVEATPAERFKVLSNLFGLELLDSIRERVKEELRSLERELLPREDRLKEREGENLEERLNAVKKEKEDLGERMGTLTREEKNKEERTVLLGNLKDTKEKVKELQKRREDLERERDIAFRKAREDQEIQKAWEVKTSFWQPWQTIVEKVRDWEEDKKTWLEKKADLEEEITRLNTELEGIRGKIDEQKTRKKNLESYEDKLRKGALPLSEEARAVKRKLQELEKERGEREKRVQELEKAVEKEREEERELERKVTEKKKKIEKEEEILQEAEKAREKIEPLIREIKEKERDISLLDEELKILQEEVRSYSKSYRKIENEWEKKREELLLWQEEKKVREGDYLQTVRDFALWELEKEWEEKGVCPLCGSEVPPPQVGVFPEVDWEGYHSFQKRGEKLLEEESSLRQKKLQEEKAIIEAKEKKKKNLEKREKLLEERIKALEALQGITLPPRVKPEKVEEFLKDRRKTREKELLCLYQLEKDTEIKRVKIEDKIKGIKEEQSELDDLEKRIKEAEELLADKREQLSQIFALLHWEDSRPPEEAFDDLWEKFLKRLHTLSQELEKMGREESRWEEKLKFLFQSREEAQDRITKLLAEGEELRKEERNRREAFQEELHRLGWPEEYFERLRDKKIGNWQERWHGLEGELRQVEKSLRIYEENKRNLLQQLGIEEHEAEELWMKEQEELQEIREELGRSKERKGSLDKEIENLQTKIEERDRLREELKEKRKDWELHYQLDKALEARGFRNYLLGFLFQELEEEASSFLEDLSQGRYSLRMKMEEGKAEMVVVDRNYGGEERLPGECSGGEKTLIALSLALALSRIHLREAGKEKGADCLFIDEGFSTLDQEHLELVADAILGLSQDGRMVGIVTHDPSFARYFPLHLEVRGGRASWKRNEEVV